MRPSRRSTASSPQARLLAQGFLVLSDARERTSLGAGSALRTDPTARSPAPSRSHRSRQPARPPDRARIFQPGAAWGSASAQGSKASKRVCAAGREQPRRIARQNDRHCVRTKPARPFNRLQARPDQPMAVLAARSSSRRTTARSPSLPEGLLFSLVQRAQAPAARLHPRFLMTSLCRRPPRPLDPLCASCQIQPHAGPLPDGRMT